MAAKDKNIISLTLNDVFCYICRGILIEPITVPCKHVFCKSCFENSLQETSYTCPLCRKRISNWLRSAKKADKLLNFDLWEQIKIQFQDEVNCKLAGKDDGLDEKIQLKYRGKTILTPAGEIGEEYSKLISNYEEERRQQQEKEEKESLALIKRLQDEERQQIEREREENAKRVLRVPKTKKSQSTTVPSSSSSSKKDRIPMIGPMDYHVKRHKKCDSSASNDSISPEMHHFKPIRVLPKTPPKRTHDGRILEISVQKISPVKLFVDRNTRFTIADPCPSIHSSFSAFKGTSPNSSLQNDEENMELVTAIAGTGVLKEINLDDSNSVGLGKLEVDGKNVDDNKTVKIPKLGVPSLIGSENFDNLYDREEQLRLEQRLLQEKADHELALKLSREWGSSYQLRRNHKAASRQTTLVNSVVRRRTK